MVQIQLVVLHLIDSYALTMPTLYISTLLLSLRSMMQMDLPHLNVLTKIDNLASHPPLPLSLSFYTEARSLDHLLPYLEREQGGSKKFTALNEAIVELVDEFGLVGFETLAVEDRSSMLQLLRAVDRASGYAFGGTEGANESIWQVAVSEGGGRTMEVRDIEERWIDRREEYDVLEKKMWEAEGKVEKRKAGVPRTQPQVVRRPGPDDDPEEDMMDGLVPLPGQDSGIKVVRKNGT